MATCACRFRRCCCLILVRRQLGLFANCQSNFTLTLFQEIVLQWCQSGCLVKVLLLFWLGISWCRLPALVGHFTRCFLDLQHRPKQVKFCSLLYRRRFCLEVSHFNSHYGIKFTALVSVSEWRNLSNCNSLWVSECFLWRLMYDFWRRSWGLW